MEVTQARPKPAVCRSCATLVSARMPRLQDTLPRAQCAAALRRVGKGLVGARAEATTRLLMELCVPGQDVGEWGGVGCRGPVRKLLMLCH